jgi:hypothetical protein
VRCTITPPPNRPARGRGTTSIRTGLIGVSLAAAGIAAASCAHAGPLPTESRCLALVAYAEAVSEGRTGMAAVIRVMHNRVRDQRFPKSACAVARQPGQFQAIDESRRYKAALKAPHRMSLARTLMADTGFERMMLRQASELALDRKLARGRDPTGGALYFVNLHMMDPGRCAWFARLKRTTAIGRHVFMTHYGRGERRRGPALDCRRVGQGWIAARKGKVIEGAPLPMLKVRLRAPVPVPKPVPKPIVVALTEPRPTR